MDRRVEMIETEMKKSRVRSSKDRRCADSPMRREPTSDEERFAIPIEQAKTAETRQRRIAKALGMLREGQT